MYRDDAAFVTRRRYCSAIPPFVQGRADGSNGTFTRALPSHAIEAHGGGLDRKRRGKFLHAGPTSTAQPAAKGGAGAVVQLCGCCSPAKTVAQRRLCHLISGRKTLRRATRCDLPRQVGAMMRGNSFAWPRDVRALAVFRIDRSSAPEGSQRSRKRRGFPGHPIHPERKHRRSV